LLESLSYKVETLITNENVKEETIVIEENNNEHATHKKEFKFFSDKTHDHVVNLYK
jgi:hypothetical protein